MEVTHGPWNLEFGSPPSTLSLHLRLKSEFEDKYPPPHTHTPLLSSTGQEAHLEEEEKEVTGHLERSRNSLARTGSQMGGHRR